jgi:hypothetical protein
MRSVGMVVLSTPARTFASITSGDISVAGIGAGGAPGAREKADEEPDEKGDADEEEAEWPTSFVPGPVRRAMASA